MKDLQGKHGSRFRRIAFALKEVVLVAFIVLLTRTALAETYYVPTGSMEPTLAVGDRLLVDKFSYGYSRHSLPGIAGIPSLLPAVSGRLFGALPAHGDVVVFRLPRDTSETYVKRVIGLPGDRVQLIDGRIWLNRQPLAQRASEHRVEGLPTGVASLLERFPGGPEHFIFKQNGTHDLDNTREFVVPADHLFVMGDNRDDSLDSRVPAWMGGVGFVPLDNLVGRADVVLASWELGLTSRPIAEWPAAVRFRRFFTAVD
jgi:signal peptidase I